VIAQIGTAASRKKTRQRGSASLILVPLSRRARHRPNSLVMVAAEYIIAEYIVAERLTAPKKNSWRSSGSMTASDNRKAVLGRLPRRHCLSTAVPVPSPCHPIPIS
jgi:hypothetical protein